jgi:FtsP/CotA-like multicopper oxidase with cupredoxin domain
MRIVSRSVGCSLIFALAAFGAGAAHAQTCTPCPLFPELVEPPVLTPATPGALSTTLRVEQRGYQVPVWTQTNNTWQCCMTPMTLRTYGYPQGSGYTFGITGPTLKVRKPSTPGAFGDAIKVNLVNALPPLPGSDHDCDQCEGCSGANPPKCCTSQDVTPNCFHGDNTTNLHFHGTHVSPQQPQDYIFLELKPAGSAYEAPHDCSGTVAIGSFQYAVDPLRYTQPEGTHWYHPHKHGSTALQVSNGMAGALIIEGPFDDWLRGYYQQQGFDLQDKLMVVQQFSQAVNFNSSTVTVPTPLVNGQANPRVKMRPGEIQRWRFVGATMQGSAQISIDFDGEDATPVVAKQIAMDGVQFAPGNYLKQPLLQGGLAEFGLSPGNRADFLVQAPTVPGKYAVTFEVFGQVENSKQAPLQRAALKALAVGALEPSLVVIEVEPCANCKAMSFPAELPQLPYYLSDIVPNAPPRTLLFELKDPSGQPVGPATMPSKFYINLTPNENRQFCACCSAITARLDTSEQWTITNTTNADPFHVFHMHVNPFQVVKNGSTTYNPPIWQDSITLPGNGSVVINQRYEEFTGGFVLHCHFLAHEDRGMMLSVQVVCPENTTTDGKLYYGKPKANGQPECVAGNLIPASPQCPVPATECKP